MSSMSNVLNANLEEWFDLLMTEWSPELSPDRKPYLWNKMLFSALESAARSFIYYAESPSRHEVALIQAIAYRRFAHYFTDEHTDFEELSVAIADRNIGYMDESCVPERPEWIPEEDWLQAQHDATHDEAGNMLRPQLLGFLTGARYEVPCKDSSEFDNENTRKVVRAAIHQCLKKTEQDYKFCLRKAAKPNSNYWQDVWNSKCYDAKLDRDTTQSFIKQHNLEYDES